MGWSIDGLAYVMDELEREPWIWVGITCLGYNKLESLRNYMANGQWLTTNGRSQYQNHVMVAGGTNL